MSFVQKWFHGLFDAILCAEEPAGLMIGYYVTPTEHCASICEHGIPLASDGTIRLFGNVNCALERRDEWAREGRAGTIWRIDVTGLDLALDQDAEVTASHAVHCESHGDEIFCHGYILTSALPPCRMLGSREVL